MDLVPVLLQGLGITCMVFVGAATLAIPLALAAGEARRRGGAIGWVATVYIEVFRGTSALVQLYWGYFVLPLFGCNLPPLAVAILVLGANAGAYGAEIARGCLNSVPVGQVDAAAALGLNRWTTWWRVSLPQAAPAMIPPAGVLLIELLKGTSLVSLIALADLTWQGQLLRNETLRSPAVYGWLFLIYLGMALCVSTAVKRLEQRMSVHLWRAT